VYNFYKELVSLGVYVQSQIWKLGKGWSVGD